MSGDNLVSGVVTYGIKETSRSDRGKRIGEAFSSMGTLRYLEVSCRDSDYELARILSASLDIKIKTLLPPNLRRFDKNKLLVILDGQTYDVIKADSDKEKRYLYFYLQRVS